MTRTAAASAEPTPREWTLKEYYETPDAFIDYLGWWLAEERGFPGRGQVCASPAHGAGRVQSRLLHTVPHHHHPRWVTNDLDPEWPADVHGDLRHQGAWDALLVEAQGGEPGGLDYVIDNPPFSAAFDCARLGLEYARTLLALHVRISFNEVTKDDPRGQWLQAHPPTQILFLPRFAFRRSPTSRLWTTDNVATCWMLWWTNGEHDPAIHYCPERYVKQLTEGTTAYRQRIDALTGYAPGA